jgi:hypothetical protein
LWLESVYAALTIYLMTPGCKRLEITGFQAGTYYDIPASYGAAKKTAPVAVRETSPEREPMAAEGQPFH